MSLREACFEECACVKTNEELGPRLYRLTLEAPKMAGVMRPGQFVHLRLPGMEAHLLRRPFSVYRSNEGDGEMEIIYQVVGEGTRFLADCTPGVLCSIMGPLGVGWRPCQGKALLVGGGVGAAPLFSFAEKLCATGHPFEVVLGAQTASMLVTREDYAALLGHDPICATDDASAGIAGFCTGPAAEELARGGYGGVYCCGPEPLMKAVAALAAEAGVPCWVSLEKRMACGVGACLSCVVDTTAGKRRSCIDGPVFDAREVIW